MALAHAAAIALKTWLTLRTWHAVTNGPPTSLYPTPPPTAVDHVACSPLLTTTMMPTFHLA